MCRDVVGKIFFFSLNHLNWKISHFTDLIPQRRSRTYSPTFGYFNESMKFDPDAAKWTGNAAGNTEFIELNISVGTEDANTVDYVEVGLINEAAEELGIFKCIWHDPSKAFLGFSQIRTKELSDRRKGSIPNGYLRFFCRIPYHQLKKVFPDVIELGSQNDTPSVVTSSSPNVSWVCTMCFCPNRADESTCISCATPKSKRKKNQATSSLTSNSSNMSASSSSSSWECNLCRFQNPVSDSLCMLCGILQPTPISNQATTSHVTSNSSCISTSSSNDNWECNMCRFSNRATESTCASCKAPQLEPIKHQGLEQLSHSFKDILKRKKYTDLTIKVQGGEYKVHRLIIKARSPEFDDMLSSKQQSTPKAGKAKKTAKNKKKNTENVIELDDFQPEVLEEFLLFIYSGKTENITCDIASGLYYAADKYNVPDLKSECVEFFKKNLFLENICEVISLATKNNEKELLNSAINYFAKNLDEILATSKWLSFSREDPIAANELCIKALDLGFTKVV